eukprot:gene18894-biopygen11494
MCNICRRARLSQWHDQPIEVLLEVDGPLRGGGEAAAVQYEGWAPVLCLVFATVGYVGGQVTPPRRRNFSTLHMTYRAVGSGTGQAEFVGNADNAYSRDVCPTPGRSGRGRVPDASRAVSPWLMAAALDVFPHHYEPRQGKLWCCWGSVGTFPALQQGKGTRAGSLRQ